MYGLLALGGVEISKFGISVRRSSTGGLHSDLFREIMWSGVQGQKFGVGVSVRGKGGGGFCMFTVCLRLESFNT